MCRSNNNISCGQLRPRDETGRMLCEMVRRFSSRELFAGCSEVLIEHNGSSYKLRLTRQGKLILTK